MSRQGVKLTPDQEAAGTDLQDLPPSLPQGDTADQDIDSTQARIRGQAQLGLGLLTELFLQQGYLALGDAPVGVVDDAHARF